MHNHGMEIQKSKAILKYKSVLCFPFGERMGPQCFSKLKNFQS